MAYRDGQDLVNQGRVTEGLVKLEEASRLDPGVAQYRVAVLQTRDRYIAAQIDRAEALRRQGRLDDAEQVFRQVLSVHGSNDRALAGLRAVDQHRRTAGWMKDAEAAVAKKDLDTARTKLKTVLMEEPLHEGARALLQKLDDQAARPTPETALAAAYRKPITIEFKDVALKTVFEVISRTSGMNFLFDKDVRTDQKTSIFLKNSTIESAVSLTLLTNQLEQRVLDGNTVLIYPNTQAKQKDYQLLTVKSFYLANAEAKTVAATLKALLKSRDVVVDDKLNLVIVRDTPEAIRLAEKLVALHDVPEPEVMLEVEILEVKRTRLLDLGVRWPDQLTLTPLAIGAAATDGSTSGTTGGALTVADLRGLNSARIGAAIGAVNINAKKTDTDANILANPRIRARNREKAKILIGERVPNITSTSTSTGFVAESINYVDVGLKLDVEPTIYLDGEVAIKIALEVSNIISQVQTKSGSIAYQIGTRTAQTVLRLKDGENQVLAGLINDEDRRSANKVPGLGEVPVVGRLFGSQSDDASKTEIVLSITPRIVRNVRRPDAALTEFESGTENSFGARPAATGAAPAPAPGTRPATAPSSPAVPGASTSPAVTSQATQSQAGTTTASATTAPLTSAVGSVTPAPSGGATLRWQGPAEVKVGDIFAVQLLMQSDQPVVSVPLAVGFDPRMLQATSVSEGEFLRQGGSQTSFASRVDPSGQVLVTGTRSGDAGATALGVFATINFRATAAINPETRVQLLTVAPVGLGGRSVAPSPAPAHVLRVTN
ncbi:tetratricopeptide repeat protein [Ramlibacter sp. WS9]|nr:tetratricopeptide repeat protein [Ramlibacter sp. WS9]